MKQNIIYALTCPDTGIVRYIGKSTVGLERPNKHKTKMSLIAQTHKNNWIKSLLAQNKTYGIKVLEECDSKEVLNEREMHWIKFYRDTGHNLTNATDGGEGSIGFRFNEKSKTQMSESAIKRGMPDKIKKHHWVRKEHKVENDQELKHCSDCSTFRLLSEYHKDKKQWDGLRPICKPCALARKNKYYTDHVVKMTPEELKQSYTDRKEAMSAGVKAAYENNPELRTKISQARSKPILRIDPQTNQVKEYPSALHAKEDGFHNTNIGVAIKKKALYKGFYWKFKA